MTVCRPLHRIPSGLVGYSAPTPRRGTTLPGARHEPSSRRSRPRLRASWASPCSRAAASGDDGAARHDDHHGPLAGRPAATNLPLKEAGTLTVATGEPAFEPWVADDDPTNGEGFEAASSTPWPTSSASPRTPSPGSAPASTRPSPPARRTTTSTSSSSHHRRARRGRRLLRRVLHGRAGNRRPPPTATSPRHLDRATSRAPARRGHRHHQPRLHRGGHPARHRGRRLRRQRRRQGRLRRRPGRRHRLRPAHRVLHHRGRDRRLLDRRRAPRQGDAEELGFLFEDGSPLVPCVNEALATLRGRRHPRRPRGGVAQPGWRHPDPGD